jgi:hypothetical protein
MVCTREVRISGFVFGTLDEWVVELERGKVAFHARRLFNQKLIHVV